MAVPIDIAVADYTQSVGPKTSQAICQVLVAQNYTYSLSLQTSRTRAYPGFRSMKRLEEFLITQDGMQVHRRVTPNIKLAGTPLYTWVERDTVTINCLAQEHNTTRID